MNDKKKCSRDAISWLPVEILGKILSLLPTKQAVSTSVLSKNWRYVFRLVDSLDFDDGNDKQGWYVFPESFKSFVDRTLALQGDFPIKKFTIKCHVGKYNESQKACVGRWIRNVIDRGVSEMELTFKGPGDYVLPHQLLASKTLVKLSLGTHIYLGKLPSFVSLPSLKFLFLDTIFSEHEAFGEVLLAGCPVLEELSVLHGIIPIPDTISSRTVKRLLVDYQCANALSKRHLSFNLPNLVYLDYSDFALCKYPQVNLESLREAKLDLHPTDFWRPNLMNLIMGIENVEILHLSPVAVDVIYLCCKDGLFLPMFNKLVNLSFGSENKRGWELLVDLFKLSPKLENLTIKDLNGYTCDISMPLNQVKVLHVLGYRATSKELKHLKRFLREIVCIEVVQVDILEDDDGKVLQATNDLLMLPGVSVSSKCNVKVTRC
ncbi:F-box/LRR-repeat protein [Cardamine amara subsp. amara]|uniref:F-box/LRR-repeat protein n=1 Tax=Cardamine amara subsp. amara TaxID=228776 RepID=A0ABD0ZII0_CARAN